MGVRNGGVKRDLVDNGERCRFEDTSPYTPPPAVSVQQATEPRQDWTWISVLLMLALIAIGWLVAHYIDRH